MYYLRSFNLQNRKTLQQFREGETGSGGQRTTDGKIITHTEMVSERQVTECKKVERSKPHPAG